MAKGGRREGAGRKKGVPNKATADIKALAQVYAPAAVTELARLMTEAESEQARVSAIKEVLDRAYGKPTQHIGGDKENPIEVVIRGLRGELNAKLDTIAQQRRVGAA